MSETRKCAVTAAILIGWLAAGYVLAADPMTFESPPTQATLIELFTSEGCSSCPPAEKWLSRFKSDPDVWKKIVPVAFHVDYWDRLGWRDRFAKPEFTLRQQRYAAGFGGDSVYTPGFVVNGKEWRGWFSGAKLPAPSGNVGKLRVSLTGENQVSATFVPGGSSPPSLQLEVALLGGDLESDVKRGENSGRKLRHDFVVLSLGQAAMKKQADDWAASLSLSRTTDGETPRALAAWVASGDSGPPLQSTGGWLKP